MPDWSNIQSLSNGSSVPDDGFVVLKAGGLWTNFYVNGKNIASFRYSDNWYYDSMCIPVCKGDIVSCSGQMGSGITFIPYK